MIQQKGQSVVDGLGFDEVVVVKHQHETRMKRCQVIDQGSKERLKRRGLSRMGKILNGLTDSPLAAATAGI